MSKNVNYNLGGRVKTLRENRGWSQEKLATKVGVTTAYLGDIERNTKNPTFHVITHIAQAFCMSLTEFFFIDREIIQELSTFTDPMDKKSILKIILLIKSLQSTPDKKELE
ncbi:helix-turn-helix domain-containing protein [uncultured Sharpea sp.]|uniref:helix-turn-helix domain-containing protein n=1 Tax=uncultured Sharpea sp. TaxID=1112738 RepID=UPI0025831E08|nr:helix-turn-helix transcriptional regulator [uncultured Sharpea sp.]